MTGPKVETDQENQEIPPIDTTQPNTESDPFAAQREEVRRQALAEANNIYSGAVREVEQRAMALQRQLDAATTQKNNPPADDPSAFLQNPQSQVRDIVRTEMRDTVAPLNEFMMEFRRTSQYDQIKSRLRIHPQLGPVLSTVEPYLDQQYQSLNPLNDSSVAGLIMGLYGQITAGFLANPLGASNVNGGNGSPPIQNHNQNNRPNSNPMPNSNPAPIPPKSNKRNIGEPTEQQRKVMKMNGIETFEEYMDWTESDGTVESMRKIAEKYKKAGA